MSDNSVITRLLRTAGDFARPVCITAVLAIWLAGTAFAAGIRIVPSAPKVTPGETFYADVVVDGIPSTGLGAIQFRMNISAPGSAVATVSDTLLGLPADVSVSSPLTIGPAATGRSGIGDFFWNAKGSHGVLVMDNEPLQNGSGLYTLGHTNGAALPSGSGSIARFQINAGKAVAAEKIVLSLSDVVLLDGSAVYPLDSNTGATVDLKCYTQAPNLLGMSKTDAAAALSRAKLVLGAVYEIDNPSGAYSLNTVLVQSANAGATVLCDTPVDLAINTPPSEVSNVRAQDKAGDESGAVVLSWVPSPSADAAGYRIYNASGVRLAGIANASSTGSEIAGLMNGVATQLRITAYDTHGNESPGVFVSATALDDVAPRISISGVADGAYYASNIQPVITVQDANLASKQFTLNGASYNQAPVMLEGNYLLTVTATDTAGNSSAREIRFTIDKTPPAIAVSGIVKGAYYNTDLSPVVSVTDANPDKAEILLNGSPYVSGTAITAENNYELRIHAVDKAGNSSSDSYPFFIDKTKPTSAVSAGTPKFENSGITYIAGATPFTLTGNDAGTVVSGIERLEYRTNKGIWNAYLAPVTLAGMNDGPVTLDYRAVDKAANIEDFHSLAVTLDTTPPVTTLSPGQPRYAGANGATYVTLNTVFSLSASDALSGVAMTEYKLDAGTWVPSAPFSIAAEGSHTILYHSKDNVGNSEPDKSLNAVVDNTPPVTTITTGNPKYTAPDGKLYVTSASAFTLAATDNLSGVAKTEYRIDNGAWTAYAPFTIAGEGIHTIDYRSQDNVTNLEALKTLTVIVDNTPPVTTITTGDPKYTAADGKLYVTSASAFTLAATDNLSGVAKTEYRIDNGAWTAYAPFKIAGEGTHIIDYRSQDNVANLEAFKTLTVIVDNTPPVSTLTVGAPQYQSDGKLYVAGGTQITIAASDALSGVNRTEYSIDGGNWNTYTAAFTLNAFTDGSHTIRYHSIDNVGNAEAPKELTVILDKTPPQTAISASDKLIDGVVNTVSPATFFTLTATDALSGVRSVAYRIDNGSWQASTGSFSLAGMTAGQHTIGFKATDNVLNEETEKTITVRLIVIDVSKKVASDPVVLVAAWRHGREDHDGKEKKIDKKGKVDKNKDGKKDGENDDKHAPNVLDKLSGILAAAGVIHHIPTDEKDFISSFRSGRYNTYLLIDGEEGEHEDLEEEIREAVNYGHGLISIKTRPDEDPELHDVLGVKFRGRTVNKDVTITLFDSPISNEGTLETAGKGLVTAITSTTTAVAYADMTDGNKAYPAIVYNAYGRGRAILFAFDLLSVPDQAKAAALLINSINHVHPVKQEPIALASMPIRVKLDNSTEPVDVRVKEYLPDTTTADSITPAQPVIDGTITWDKSLKPLEKAVFGYYLNLPDLAGSYRTRSQVLYSNSGDYRPYGTYDMTLTVQMNSANLLADVLHNLEALRTQISGSLRCGHDDDDDDERNDPDTGEEHGKTCAGFVTQAIRELSGINTLASDLKAAEKNIESIREAIEKVRKLKVDVTEIRLNLDELLRIWEKKWYLMGLPR